MAHAVECASIHFTSHAALRMAERFISLAEVIAIVRNGEVIEDNPNDTPFPSVLLLGHGDGRMLHVLVSRDPQTRWCFVVTVYRPDPTIWSDGGKRRNR
jgi:hypothetical protein